MNFLLRNCKELNYGELLAVNGGCSGWCSGYSVPSTLWLPVVTNVPQNKRYSAPESSSIAYRTCGDSGGYSSGSGVCSGTLGIGGTGHMLYDQHMMREYNDVNVRKSSDTFTGNACGATSLLNEVSEL